MFRIDRTFKNRVIKWTVILQIALEIIMVIINFPNVTDIIQYCSMAAVIIIFTILSEIKGIAFAIRNGLIYYTDDAVKIEKKEIDYAKRVLEEQLEKLEKQLNKN